MVAEYPGNFASYQRTSFAAPQSRAVALSRSLPICRASRSALLPSARDAGGRRRSIYVPCFSYRASFRPRATTLRDINARARCALVILGPVAMRARPYDGRVTDSFGRAFTLDFGRRLSTAPDSNCRADWRLVRQQAPQAIACSSPHRTRRRGPLARGLSSLCDAPHARGLVITASTRAQFAYAGPRSVSARGRRARAPGRLIGDGAHEGLASPLRTWSNNAPIISL